MKQLKSDIPFYKNFIVHKLKGEMGSNHNISIGPRDNKMKSNNFLELEKVCLTHFIAVRICENVEI